MDLLYIGALGIAEHVQGFNVPKVRTLLDPCFHFIVLAGQLSVCLVPKPMSANSGSLLIFQLKSANRLAYVRS